MSRGPGSVERAIETAFTSAPSSIFTTDDLVRLAYPCANRAEKKHRVAVLRAVSKVAQRMWWAGYRCSEPGGQFVWCNMCDLRSYAFGRERANFSGHSSDLARLIETIEPGGKKYSAVQPGGAWHKHVEISCLSRDGRHEEAKAMLDAWNGPLQKKLNVLGAAIRARASLGAPKI